MNIKILKGMSSYFLSTLPKRRKRIPKDSHSSFVENIGLEPMTSCMPCKRSSQLS